MTAEAAHDWLWHYLQRVPQDEALLRTVEARLIAGLELPAPCLDLRDRFGRGRLPGAADHDAPHTSALIVATGPGPTPDSAALDALWALLPDGAPVVLCLPRVDDQSAAIWNTQLNHAGFVVLRWRSYYSTAQQQAAAALRSPWPQLSYDLTGHYVFTPWRSVLTPAAQRLRPLDVPLPPTDDDGCLFFIARRADAPTEQPLPPADATLQPQLAQPDDAEIPAINPDMALASPTPEPAWMPAAQTPTRHGALPTVLPGATALLLALLALLAMRARPAAVGSGLGLLAVALIALLATGRAATPGAGARPLALPHWSRRKLALVGGGLLAALLAAAGGSRPLIALPLWLLGSILTLAALVPTASALPLTEWRRWQPPRTPTALALSLTLVAALVVRLWRVGSHPFIINGIEAQLGLEALQLPALFGTAWLTHPLLPLWPTRLSIALLGQTPPALRLWSPFVGAATVLVVFWAGRTLWNGRVGLLAALFVAFSHAHIHYSRLGMSNVGDALLVTLALGALAAGWHSGRRVHWLLAGAAIGLSAYFFSAAHLLPLMLVALLLPALLDGGTLRRQLAGLAAAALLALVIALPQLLVYAGNPALFMERANVLGIARNGWLANSAAQTGSNPLTLLGQRLWQAALGYHAAIDVDTVYNPGVPLLNLLVGTLLLLGLGMALAHARQMRYAVWLVAFTVTLTFGGALLLDLPSSRRYIVALPAVCLLAARAASWLIDKVAASFAQAEQRQTAQQVGFALLVGIGLLAGALDVGFYFGRYQRSGLFADRNSEIGAAVGQYLATLETPTTVYFHGAPAMYVSAPTISFLAPQFVPGVNLFDVEQPGIWPPASTPGSVHVFVPERSGELGDVMAQQPGGLTFNVPGRYADPLFVVYELRP